MIDISQCRASIGLWYHSTQRTNTDGILLWSERSRDVDDGYLATLSLILFISLLLILAGDIELNPGPTELTSSNAVQLLIDNGFNIKDKWIELITLLRVSLEERERLETMASSDQDFHHALEEGLQLWITNNTDPSWEELVSAIENCGDKDIAIKMREQLKTKEEALIPEDILKEIQGLITWPQLGLVLNIEKEVIERTAQLFGGDEKRTLQHVVKNWLDNDPDASWEKLAKAMMRIPMLRQKGAQLYSKYVSKDLTADAVCKELEDLVQDWFQLGYMFLCNSQRVREAGTGDSNEEKRRNVIGYWLKSDPIASWELVARRIEDCFPQHEALAEEIRQKYLPKVDTTPLIRPPTPEPDTELTVKTTFESTQGVDDWYALGWFLKLKQEELLDIEKKHTRPDQRRNAVLQLWLEKHPISAEWVDLANALQCMPQHVGKSETIRTKYCKTEKSTDPELSVVKKDKSIQFDYLTDTLRGVHVGDKNLFLIQGDCPQSFNWEEYGLRISVPQGTLSVKETCVISVRSLVGGQFTFPKGTQLVSVIYTVSISKPLLKPVKLEIQHCAHLVTQGHTSYLSFVIASSKQPVLPYQFQLLKGGQFYPGNRYGSISLSHFCLLGIIRFRSFFCPIGMLLSSDDTSSDITSTVITSQPSISESQEITTLSSDDHETSEDIQLSSLSLSSNDQSSLMKETPRPSLEPFQQPSLSTPNIQSPRTSSVQDESPIGSSPDDMYIGQVVYEVIRHDSEWLMRFMVTKDLNGLLEYIKTSSSNVMRDTHVSFTFQDVNGFIELFLGEEQEYPYDGWSISPHSIPSLVSKREVDMFGAQSPPSIPSTLITISVDHSPSTVKRIKYSVPLKGVEANIKKICIVRSLNGSADTVPETMATTKLTSHQPIVNKDPSKIFQLQSAKLCEAIEADPLRVANGLNADELIGPNVRKNIKGSGSLYDKADTIVEELQRQIEADSNPIQLLKKISSFLQNQSDKTLNKIGNEIFKQLSQ